MFDNCLSSRLRWVNVVLGLGVLFRLVSILGSSFLNVVIVVGLWIVCMLFVCYCLIWVLAVVMLIKL